MITIRRIRRYAWACLLTALTCLPAQADPLEQIRSTGKIRIAIINGLPSFSHADANQVWSGSDVDTARLLAKDLKVKPEFVQVANAERISALQTGRADIIVSALSITPEREQLIAFSLPYSAISLVIGAHPQTHISGYRDLGGKRIGVGRNTSDGAMLKQNVHNAQIIEYEDENALLNGYLARQFEVISCQRASIAQLNRQLPARQQIEEKFVQREFQVAIGMRKKDAALRSWINQWVSSNLANGRLNEIFMRHHGRALPETVLPSALKLSGARS